MATVQCWTGAETKALRQAMRVTDFRDAMNATFSLLDFAGHAAREKGIR